MILQSEKNKNMIIEASAGTGKTFAIENVFVDLLKMEGVLLDQILVVTFTEKATGEMKERIRKNIEKNLGVKGNSPSIENKLRDAVDNFDRAAIYTIHGFCDRVLREYSYECNVPFELNIVDDSTVIEEVLKMVERERWFVDFVAKITDLMNSPEKLPKSEKVEEFDEKTELSIRKLVANYNPSVGDKLLPEDGPMHFRLQVSAVKKIREQIGDYKLKQGVISYNDMLQLVHSALEKGDTLAKALQARFKYALVDEFQDTDKIQWNIFKKLFAERNRLIVVGDPKQAIYGFRGADISAYLQATEFMRAKKDSVVKTLDENWRSIPQINSALNKLFREKWFENSAETPPAGIEYKDIKSPQGLKNVLESDRSGRKSLNFYSLGKIFGQTGKPVYEYNEFVVSEIMFLLGRSNDGKLDSSPITIRTSRSSTARPINEDDICILVQKRSEAKQVERLFQQNNIPYTFYKKPGIYQSREAKQIQYMLSAIADKNDSVALKKALLCDFFQVRPEEVEKVAEQSTAIHRQFQNWLEFAEQREWSHLFRSLIEKSKAVPLQGESEYERILTNYQHILCRLESDARKQHLDIASVRDLLKRYINQSEELAQDENVHPLETEKPRVKIMTIHASKGLQFPVVFIMGGITKATSNNESYYKFHDDEGNIVYDLSKSDESKERWKVETENENKRLYYVAFTRAIFKLYAPFVCVMRKYSETNIKIAPHAGPLASYLYETIAFAWPEQQGKRGDEVVEFISKKTERPTVISETFEHHQKNTKDMIVYEKPAHDALFFDDSLQFRKRCVISESYSNSLKYYLDREISRRPNMQRGFQKIEAKETFGGHDEEEISTTPGLQPAIEKEVQLPGGKNTGLLIHSILQDLDFTLAKASTNISEFAKNPIVKELVESRLLEYNLSGKTEQGDAFLYYEIVVDYLWNTLHLALPGFDGKTKLCDIQAMNILREVEFNIATDVPDDQQHRGRKTYLNGAIDMLFKSNDGKYYFVDWKTDTLSGNFRKLEEYIQECKYDLQYKLYSVALNKWLKGALKNYNPERHFGGLFYIFIRNVTVRPESAVFWKRPSPQEINQYESDILKLVNTHFFEIGE